MAANRYSSDRNDLRGAKEIFQKNGLKYNHLGARPNSTMSSLFGRKETAEAIQKADRALGEGYIQVQYRDRQGNAIKEPFQNEDGRLVIPDSDGVVVLHDEQYYEMLEKLDEEFQDMVDKNVKRCLVSDYVCAQLLGNGLFGELKKTGGSGITVDGVSMSDELKAIDGKPSVIKSFPTDSIQQTQALSKLRYVVSSDQCRINYTNKTGTSLSHTEREADKA